MFAALLEFAVKFGDLKSASEPYIWGKDKLKAAYDSLPQCQKDVLVRTSRRIQAFAGACGEQCVGADLEWQVGVGFSSPPPPPPPCVPLTEAQRASVTEMTIDVPGGRCGQKIAPVGCAGCYAPGGRYPLPSSVLMTAATAFAAGVKKVVLASPKPSPVTAAAAYVAGADSLLIVGGAQAIASMAFGVGEVPACDVIVGPGPARPSPSQHSFLRRAVGCHYPFAMHVQVIVL